MTVDVRRLTFSGMHTAKKTAGDTGSKKAAVCAVDIKYNNKCTAMD